MDDPDRLVLRPARGAASAWGGAGALLIAAGLWLVVDSRGAPLSWVAVAVFTAVGTYFVLQALVPSWFTIVCDPSTIRGRALWHRVGIGWDRVRLAQVDRFVGDPVLRLHVDDHGLGRTLDVLLPIGADVAALHAFLHAKLGPADVHDLTHPIPDASRPRSTA